MGAVDWLCTALVIILLYLTCVISASPSYINPRHFRFPTIQSIPYTIISKLQILQQIVCPLVLLVKKETENMADEVQYHHHDENKSGEPCDSVVVPKAEEYAEVEATDRGLFDFVGKKEEEKKCEEAMIATEFEEKVQVCEENKEEEKKKHEGLHQKLHRSSSSSSSSSDEEEVEEGGEKKKKGLKEKIKEKISGEKKEEEKCDEIPTQEPEEKKGLLDEIKEKLPGGKKAEEVEAPPPTPAASECASTAEAEGKEKKGFLEKIKEKIPGYHSKSDEEKEKGKEEAACH